MALPNYLRNVKTLNERFEKAFKQESNWYEINNDVYEYFLPQRNLYNEDNPGAKKMDKIFDSTALEAIQEGASRVQENIAPIWKRWAKPEPSETAARQIEEAGDELGFTIEDAKENLDKEAEIAFDYINRSNFATQFYEATLDMFIGTATMRIEEEDSLEMPFSFHAMPPKILAYEEGPSGKIETHWMKIKECARNIKRRWPGFKIDSELETIINKSPEQKVEIRQGVVYDPQTQKYYGVAWRENRTYISWEADYEQSSPLTTGRWSKVSGEVRGRGPAMQAYPDVRSLNKVKEFVLQKAAIDLAGMYTATDDGVTNPYTLTIAPGVVIPVGSNNTSNPSIQRLDTRGDLQLAQFEINELRTAIKRAFFNDLRDPDGPVRSATEVAIEARELAKRIGSAFGRLQTEFLEPILKRVFFILRRKGLIGIDLQGFETTIKFTSPLAAAQDQEDLIAIQQAIEFTAATAGPDMIKASFETQKFGSYAGRLTGMPQELISSEANMTKKIEAGAQAAQAAAEMGKPGAMNNVTQIESAR